MKVLKTGLIYFALVFGAGFILGPIRVLWAVPRLGERTAELLEMPIMLAVIIWVARRLRRWGRLPANRLGRLSVGLVALALLLTAEFTLVLALRGMTIEEYFATADPVSGTVYALMLGLFALMPLLVARDE